MKLDRYHIPALLLLAAAAYCMVGVAEFVNFDDDHYVTGNVEGGLTFANVEWAFTSFNVGNWHPLTTLSYELDHELFGLNPSGWHLHNLLLHVINTVLAYLVLRRLTGNAIRAMVVAAIWSVHPLRVEVVAWVSERKELLAMLFGLSAILAYARYVQQRSVGRYLLMMGLFALCLMSKPMWVTLPFLLLLLDYWPLHRLRGLRTRSDWKQLAWLALEKAPLLPLVVFSCAMTIAAQKSASAITAPEVYPAMLRPFNAAVAYWWYVWRLLVPTDLCVLYPLRYLWPLWLVILSAASFLLTTWLLFRAGRWRGYLAVGWLWFAGTLVPVVGLVQVGSQRYADRYTYLPHLGLLILVVWGVADLLQRYQPRLTLVRPIILAGMAILVISTWLQVGYWRNSIALFTHALDVDQRNAIALTNLGKGWRDEGDQQRAMDCFHQALRIAPGMNEATASIGHLLCQVGQADEAIIWLNRALSGNPDSAEDWAYLGVALAMKGDYQAAMRVLGESLRLDPNSWRAHYNIGATLNRIERPNEAMAHFKRAADLAPSNPDLQLALGKFYLRLGRIELARHHLQVARDLAPNDRDLQEAINQVWGTPDASPPQ
ncbi:MAG: tetratricopeptide repeat protein [Phycisphaeraceae bacterium]